MFPSLRAGSRAVDSKKLRDPTKMAGCLLAGLRDDRQVQAPANYLSDVANRYSLVGNAVIRGSSRTLLKHKPVKTGSIEPVHCGPSVKPVTDICRSARFTRNVMDTRAPRSAIARAASSDLRGKAGFGASSSVARG